MHSPHTSTPVAVLHMGLPFVLHWYGASLVTFSAYVNGNLGDRLLIQNCPNCLISFDTQ